MTQIQFQKAELQLFWIIGCIERLSGLGMLATSGYPTIPSSKVDFFIQVDEQRTKFFNSDVEIRNLVKIFLEQESNQEPDDKLMEDIQFLVLDYFHHRERIMKHALSHLITK